MQQILKAQHTASRIRFPLAQPRDASVEAMAKAWTRADLVRYQKRWARGWVPPVPREFMAYSWRACDIGCGFGKYLLRESALHPDRAYLGIDKGNLRGGSMLKRFETANRPNLFGLHCNAIPFLASLPDRCLDSITVFYPNPWWPSKHRKKRWPYHPLFPKLAALLKKGGVLLVTSNEGFYLEEWVYAMDHHPAIQAMAPIYRGPMVETEGRTHFETKFIEAGTPCGELRFQKID